MELKQESVLEYKCSVRCIYTSPSTHTEISSGCWDFQLVTSILLPPSSSERLEIPLRQRGSCEASEESPQSLFGVVHCYDWHVGSKLTLQDGGREGGREGERERGEG